MNIHAEILAGTDESIDVGDFMSGGKSTFAPRLFRFHVVSLSCS
jgi:hypothetical protein